MEILGGDAAFVSKHGGGVDATCATYEYFAVVLRVEIYQDGTFDKIRVEVLRAFEANLLVDSEERLYGTMLESVVNHHSQSGSYADAIVSTEGSATGLNPVAIDIGVDRVFHEVMLHVVVLLAYHIHVALEDDDGGVLMTGSGCFAHNHVSTSVGVHLDIVLLSKIQEICSDLLFMARGAGHLCDLIETAPD